MKHMKINHFFTSLIIVIFLVLGLFLFTSKNNDSNLINRKYAPIEKIIGKKPNPFINMKNTKYYIQEKNNSFLGDPFFEKSNKYQSFLLEKNKPVVKIFKKESNLKVEYQIMKPEDVFKIAINNSSDKIVFNNLVYSAYATENNAFISEKNSITTYIMDKNITSDDLMNIHDKNGNRILKVSEAPWH